MEYNNYTPNRRKNVGEQLTLSNPAMFLFSAKNSAGDSAGETPEKIQNVSDKPRNCWLEGIRQGALTLLEEAALLGRCGRLGAGRLPLPRCLALGGRGRPLLGLGGAAAGGLVAGAVHGEVVGSNWAGS